MQNKCQKIRVALLFSGDQSNSTVSLLLSICIRGESARGVRDLFPERMKSIAHAGTVADVQLDQSPKGKKCKGMVGLIEEGSETIKSERVFSGD
jgi:hypothetical protein